METGKKYKLTNESITFCNRKLYRIEALKDFSNVKKGDKGGFVESEENLSQNGDCWIYDNAKVFENAEIFENARVFENACVFGNARVSENTKVFGNAKVYGNAMVSDKAYIYGNAKVYGNANIFDNAMIHGDAQVYRNAMVFGKAKICEDATITSDSDYIVFKNWWSSGRYFTWTRSNNMWNVGCFYGTGEELIAKAYKDSELSGREYERVVKYVESILKNSK